MEIDVVPALAGLTAYQVIDDVLDTHRTNKRLIAEAEADRLNAPAREARSLLDAQVEADWRESLPQPEEITPQQDYTPFRTESTPEWDEYVGQEALKRQIRVAINGAKARGERLEHVLLASGMPGVGKTTMARIIAKEMGVRMVELVPPFNSEGLALKARELGDGDILFIDEIHKLADNGKRGAEILLKLLEDHVVPVGHELVQIADITVVGATTDVDMLPEPVIDRFKITPEFEPYSFTDLMNITMNFMGKLKYEFVPDSSDNELIMRIAKACKRTPRRCEKFVMAARNLAVEFGRHPTAEEVLEFTQIEPDGMERKDIKYLLTMLRQGRRTRANGDVEYIAGEALLMSTLRETKNGVQRIERFLLEQGYLERTPSGRRLTEEGIETAMYFAEHTDL
jgi:Holliday junction DNA helicase RuvB